jgi:hypothetical protein
MRRNERWEKVVYTVIIGYDNLVEIYQLKKYNQAVKEAIECISTYGGDCVETVLKGEIIETMHEISSLKEMIKRFEDSEFFEAFYQVEDRERINHYKKLLEDVAIN